MKEKEFKVIVVDDDIGYAKTCAKVIARSGYTVAAFGTAEEALEAIHLEADISLLLTDLKMPGKDGLELLHEAKSINSSLEIIIMTGYGTIESAVRAMKHRATDYITKPFDSGELLDAIERVYKVWRLQHEVKRLKRALSDSLKLEGFVFTSALMSKVYDRILSACRCGCAVLVSGESGTGKELIARAIHANSTRSNRPFVAINCGALSSSLIESELFGYRRGAFTGADRDYDGLFIAADGGTLFLDEITEMLPGTQAKLLRAIQERAVRFLGSVAERKIDVRFIAATNCDIRTALTQNILREDLYHRLNVISIESPPLRKMKEEIPALLNYFLQVGNEKHAGKIRRIDDSAMKQLIDYPWPGNIREVENLIESLIAQAKSEVVTLQDLPPDIANFQETDVAQGNSVPTFSEAERDLIIRALKEAKGNKSRVAEMLAISRPRLYKKIELYDIKDE
jgi:DNA-binding NtrC family response regulator